ncbi:MAG: two-component system, OmpR family, response regulator MprA [Solirubrobacterales bacterium]|jgi:two-component system response regulator MprA|nr:two-component system, OmpR family, response regulator MprA [Solirubrobacterales bacterium]
MSEGVLIVEDDAPVRRMLERSLGAEGFDVRSAADGGTALAMIEQSTPDLVVLDVAMPGLSGIDVCRRLRERGMTGGVLMLTARDAVEDRVRGLEAGADDYVVKPFAIEEVAARLRALLRRGRDRSTRISFGAITLDTATNSIDRGGGERIELTAREAQLLEMLMRNPRTVLSRREAVERIWDGAAVENVVDRYVARLRRKLEDPLLIRTVWGVGFILQP